MWIKPSEENLKQEFHVEVELKGNAFFSSINAFMESAERGEVVEVTPEMDSKISYRSKTKSKEHLLGLIRGYRSYPEFRNEKTIENLYERIGSGQTMTMPLVVRFKNGSLRVLAGNTRMDVAFQLGANPMVLILDEA